VKVVVVGGGLAGISCALQLADRGHSVTLLERASHLGGLCRSVEDPVAGRVDTGQHVYLGCCTELERLLERIGARPALRQRRLRLTVVEPGGKSSRLLEAANLPAPLHLLPVLLRWPGLPASAVLQAARVARAASPQDPMVLDGVPALAWLQSLGQDPGTIDRLWEPFLVSACNVSLARCSAALAAYVIQEGLLRSAQAGALRLPGTDLTSWLNPKAELALAAAGVDVHRGLRATAARRSEGGGFEVTDAGGGAVRAEVLVLATAAAQAQRLLQAGGIQDPLVKSAAELPDSPIVNLHLFTDRPFLPGPVVVVPRSPLQWLFDRSAIDGTADGPDVPYHSAISLSAADDTVGVAEGELTDRLWGLCQAIFPAAARARLVHSRVTREAHATFSPLPGSGGQRPGAHSSTPGILLAGSWTDTGWPATMEGAVRSGVTAASAAPGAAPPAS
jgi:squalene-associated FAD-dependent desaturase